MRLRSRIAAWSGGLAAALLAVCLSSALVGPEPVPASAVVAAAANGLVVPVPAVLGAGPPVEWVHPFGFPVERTHAVIVRRIRLPRIALGAVVGFALATAGTVMQGFFRNPMADPSIVGVSSGAAAGAVAYLVFPLAVPLGLGLHGAAFLGGLVAAFGVYAVATEGGRTPTATLLLAGVAVQTFLGAVVSFMLLRSGEGMRRVVYWLMGHLENASWSEPAAAAAVAVPLFVVTLAHARDLNVLLLGEVDAAAVGVEVERTKRLLLAASSVVTGAAVAVSGVIGFVGLVVPHVMRLLVGPDHRLLLPASALAGSVFLVAADTVARAGTAELPVGIVTAAVGAPFFLYLLRDREVHEL